MSQSVEFTHSVLPKWNHLENFSDSNFSFSMPKMFKRIVYKIREISKNIYQHAENLKVFSIRWRAYLKKFTDFITFLLFEEKRGSSI